MRIRRVSIEHWRNLRDVDLVIPDDSTLVCLVGENGTGKSAVLELVAACAHRLGISQGVEMARGDPFADAHRIRVHVNVTTDDIELPEPLLERVQSAGEVWTGDICLEASTFPETVSDIYAEGFTHHQLAQEVAHNTVNLLRSRRETQHLYLDADRAYPPIQIQAHQFGEIYQQRWDDPDFTRQFAFRSTKTLYEEWLKYFTGLEQKVSTQFVTAIRRARETGEPEPVFVDPFDGFRSSVQAVLPHLHFVGVESEGPTRFIMFDSVGQTMSFSRLSSGEREIAFLIGQIDRFQLRRGLLLIDEPELHLNPDLVRNWLAYLRETVQDGQVWIATHSLEAVEVAGPTSTFVFEREAETRLVHAPSTLAGRPVVAALSAAIGAPAFSLSQLRFVFVEGERQTRERERFFAIAGDVTTNRFLEGGNCNEVLRRFTAVRELAESTDEQLRVGAVIDRDFRTDEEAALIEATSGAHVLRCHEIENVFLHPATLELVAERLNSEQNNTRAVTVEAADRLAGLWIAQRAAWNLSVAPTRPAMSVLADADFGAIDGAWTSIEARSLAEMSDARDEWREALRGAVEEYRRARASDDIWKLCLGKQAVGHVARRLGLSSADGLQRHVTKLWRDGTAEPPEAVVALRQYIDQIATIS